MIMSFEGCETCRFFHKEDGTTVCRRYPPLTHIVGVRLETGEPVMQSVFPPMMPQGWCGEYSEKNAPPGLAGLSRDRSN